MRKICFFPKRLSILMMFILGSVLFLANNMRRVILDCHTQSSPSFLNKIEHFIVRDEFPQRTPIPSDTIPSTVHVLWCGQRIFQFENYLSLLSIHKVIRPLKILFHYEKLPAIDRSDYHTWFDMAQKEISNLVLRPLKASCDPTFHGFITTVMKMLGANGGIYVGDSTLVTKFDDFGNIAASKYLSHSIQQTNELEKKEFSRQGVIIAHKSLANISESIKMIVSAQSLSPALHCVTVVSGNISHLHQNADSADCIILNGYFYPRDFWELDSSVGEAVRWLFYGQREVKVAQSNPENLIPLIGHMVWLDAPELGFSHYLCILSALYVGKLQHVYFHSNIVPKGKYWKQLVARENITFLHIDSPETVFQNRVYYASHASDVLRVQILHKYGGVYHDRDAVWLQPLADYLRSYDCVMSYDWPYYGAWPETLSIGAILARPGAPWLEKYLKTMRGYNTSKAVRNIVMAYRTYELYPDLIKPDRHFQVICFYGICHPAWEEGYIRGLWSKEKTLEFDWRKDAYLLHVTAPKPPKSYESPQSLKNGTDLDAQIGRYILEQAGLTSLILPP